MPVYYVRPDGNNLNDGLGPAVDRAWATFGKAWTAANTAGDLVWIAPGYYNETLGTKDHGTSANPVQYIGDPTGTVFGVSPGNVRVKEFYSVSVGSKTCRYIVLKNLLIGTFTYGDNTSNYAINWWIKAINIVLYNTANGFYRRGGTGASSSAAYLYCYNCSFSGVVISHVPYGNYYFQAYFYNCAAGTSINFSFHPATSSLTRDYCIAPTVGGTNSIAADPLFVDPTNYDFRLQPASQAIDSGYDFLGVQADPDVYGSQRIYGTIDRGAAETSLYDLSFAYPAADGDRYYYSSGPKARIVCPTPAGGNLWDIHFVMYAYQDSLRTTLIQSWDSAVNPERFEYWNGSLWLPFPAGGLGSPYYGNEVRCNFSLSPRSNYYFTADAYVAA